ncbi:SBBP repeat-containing protein [Leptospira interrogans serovar Szwajizak]|uniref:SBBP repeat-containing protein n=1 Tax=Leptospira interrogans TaxID=173 RepID=UPI00036DE705|nr:SBBP repeat-containing protein [Leptospira interrogans]
MKLNLGFAVFYILFSAYNCLSYECYSLDYTCNPQSLLINPSSLNEDNVNHSNSGETFSNSGTRQWTRLLGVAGVSITAYGITSDSLGNVYTTGMTSGNLDGQVQSGTQDLFVTKYDGNGNKQWTRLLGVAGIQTLARGITSDNLGNVYTTGMTSGNLDGQVLSGTQDLFVTKYDGIGNKQWTRLLGVAGQITQANGIASDSSGNTYLTGRTSGSLDGQILSGTQDLFVMKYDSGGNKQWTRLLGVAGVSTTAYGITSNSLGDLYSTGITSGNLDGQILTGTQDLFVLKYR